jgi:hypothetical protein
MSRGFFITHQLLDLEISIERVGRLYIHEETIPSVVDALAEKIKGDGQFTHPIIVDKNSLVVLDGMHRVAAVQKIGYEFIPVCLVDYGNPNIIISSWHRVLQGTSHFQELLAMLEELGLRTGSTDWESAYDLVERRQALTAVFSEKDCFAVHDSCSGITQTYEVIKQFESNLLSRGFSVAYDTPRGAKEQVRSGKARAGLMTPTISKDEVVQVARAGKVFPQKSTRHIIPARPMMINIPNEWLTGQIDLNEANDLLVKHLSSKKVRHLPGGQILDRPYEEELYIFE